MRKGCRATIRGQGKDRETCRGTGIKAQTGGRARTGKWTGTGRRARSGRGTGMGEKKENKMYWPMFWTDYHGSRAISYHPRASYPQQDNSLPTNPGNAG